MPTVVQPLAAGLWRIPTVRFDLVNSYALAEDDGSVTLVDVGFPRGTARLAAALDAIGRARQDVRRIVLTHAHADHAGGAHAWQERTGAQVLAHGEDAVPLGTGTSPGGDQRYRLARWLGRVVHAGFDPVRVDVRLSDGQVLDVAGGLRVVHTPGHTPGHVSLLHEPSGVLITGDVIANTGGLTRMSPLVCQDFPLSLRSSHALAELDYRVAAFTHGPPITEGARERVRRFVASRARGTSRHARREQG